MDEEDAKTNPNSQKPKKSAITKYLLEIRK